MKWMVRFTLRPLYSWGNSCRYTFCGRMCGPQVRSGHGSKRKCPFPYRESKTVVFTDMFSEWAVNNLCRIRLNSWVISWVAVSWWTNYITSCLNLCSSEFNQDTGCRCLLVGLGGTRGSSWNCQVLLLTQPRSWGQLGHDFASLEVPASNLTALTRFCKSVRN